MNQVFVLYTQSEDNYVRIVGVYQSKGRALQGFDEKISQRFLTPSLALSPEQRAAALQSGLQRSADLRATLARYNSVDMGYKDYCIIEETTLEA